MTQGSPSRRAGLPPGVPVAAAALQLLLCARLGAEEFWLTAALSWAATLVLAREATATPTSSAAAEAPRARSPAATAALAFGLALVVASLVELAASAQYRMAHRLMPLLAGVGLAIAAGGARAIACHRRALAVLCLPLVNPPPLFLRPLLDTSPWTAQLSRVWLAVTGMPSTCHGAVLTLPSSTLIVARECSGLGQIFELLTLAALIVALFPTSRLQKLYLAATAVAVGLLVNSLRVTLLARLAEANRMQEYELWHLGKLAPLFSLAATLVAGALWWWTVLRPRRRVLLTPAPPSHT